MFLKSGDSWWFLGLPGKETSPRLFLALSLHFPLKALFEQNSLMSFSTLILKTRFFLVGRLRIRVESEIGRLPLWWQLSEAQGVGSVLGASASFKKKPQIIHKNMTNKYKETKN